MVTQFRGTSWQLGIYLHQRNRGLCWWTHHASLWRGMLHTSEASPSPLPLGRLCGTEGNLGVWSRRPWCYGGLPPPCNGVGGVGSLQALHKGVGTSMKWQRGTVWLLSVGHQDGISSVLPRNEASLWFPRIVSRQNEHEGRLVWFTEPRFRDVSPACIKIYIHTYKLYWNSLQQGFSVKIN